MGRPSKYQPAFAEQAAKLCALGATDAELAEFFDVSVRTLHRWKIENEHFCHSIKAAKSEADDRIERALFARASGFEFKEQQAIKVKVGDGSEKIEIVEVERVAPPDTTAMIFWLKNRRPDLWRDKTDVNHSGTVGVRQATEYTDEELASIAAGGGGGVAAAQGRTPLPH